VNLDGLERFEGGEDNVEDLGSVITSRRRPRDVFI